MSCWLWTGSTTPAGYGRFRLPDRTVAAHRWVYEFLRAPIEPAGLSIDHECNVRNCVNPWHLDAVPHWENIERMSRRGRWRALAPEQHVRGIPFRGVPPAYRRLADQVADEIESGARAPSSRALVGLTDVVARNAVQLLVIWGYLVQCPTGLFVADDPPMKK